MVRFRPAKMALCVALTLLISACGGGGGSGGGNRILPASTPTPVVNAAAFTCPTSVNAFAVPGARASAQAQVRRSAPTLRNVAANPAMNDNLLVVTYDTARVVDPRASIDARASALGAKTAGSLEFERVGRAARVIHVDPSNASMVAEQLRSMPGVVDVSRSRRIFPLAVNGPYLTNDPYFRGVPGATPPLYQTSATSGQWDMHVIGLEDAFAYSRSNNGSGITNVNALGSTSVKLAIIDTGEDVTHPELSNAHVVYTRCFITDPTGSSQSTGTFVTDPSGHGTDVAGIAGDAVNNGFGFVGAAGNVSLMLYRIFPTPDDNCASPDTKAAQNDPQCGATDIDTASAINDAVLNGAKVINLSLGLGIPCNANGQDPDAVQGNAIANAIAHNVIVVVASGNGGGSVLAAPACDPGVIAAGASAYNDGMPNGTNYTGPNHEYVTSYSQSGTIESPRDPSSWGIVAPGGDACCAAGNGTSSDNDRLHYVENIWTSTPFDANFAGACGTDVFIEANDCRIGIVGTSMATPHVAGAAALVLSVSGVGGIYDSPAAMKQLLCSTADSIGDPRQGCGRLNVYRAVAKAIGDLNLP